MIGPVSVARPRLVVVAVVVVVVADEEDKARIREVVGDDSSTSDRMVAAAAAAAVGRGRLAVDSAGMLGASMDVVGLRQHMCHGRGIGARRRRRRPQVETDDLLVWYHSRRARLQRHCSGCRHGCCGVRLVVL